MLTGIRTYKTFVTVNYVALSFEKGAMISEHAGQGRKRKKRSGRFALSVKDAAGAVYARVNYRKMTKQKKDETLQTEKTKLFI